jgi:hypothetical protein
MSRVPGYITTAAESIPEAKRSSRMIAKAVLATPSESTSVWRGKWYSVGLAAVTTAFLGITFEA